jgi:tetratricopeptide (TPR) repeat protein
MRHPTLVLPLVSLLAVAGASAASAAPAPWDGKPFSAAPADLLAAAGAVPAPAGVGVVMLLEEGRYTFDADGRLTWSYRQIYRIVTQEGVDGWGDIGASWSPWYEERPTLRARVITADGVAHDLDGATVADSPAVSGDPSIYGDRRVLRAPLPGIAVGAVVELQLAQTERVPFFAGGTTYRFYFGASVPIQHVRLIIEAPPALPLRTVQRLLPDLKPRQERTKTVVRWTYEAGPLAALDEPEDHLPEDVPMRPYVAFATGASWADVAGRYARIIEARTADAGLASAAEELKAGGAAPAEIAARGLAWVKRRVRYSGLELGQAEITPWKPADSLARGYGDCKDQATLLAALLVAAGLPARVALLRTGPGPDLEPDLPGLGAFDHAIVVVDGKERLWIDPTAELAVAGDLPISDRDRLALVIAPGTKRLVRTPPARAADNRTVETRVFMLAERGPSRVTETSEEWGAFAVSDRLHYRDQDPKDIREHLEKYAKATYMAKRLTSYSHTPPEDLSAPFRLVLEVADADRARTYSDAAAVYLRLPVLLDNLPSSLTDGEEHKPRVHDFVVFVPYVYEVRSRLVPPPGFAPATLPPDEVIPLGPYAIQLSFARQGDEVTATYRFEVTRTRLTPAEVDAVRKAVKALDERTVPRVTFDQVGVGLARAGRTREALDEFRRLAALHPTEALHLSQQAEALVGVGLGAAAVDLARRAVALEPSSADAQSSLCWVLVHDRFGRWLGEGFDRAGAIAACRKAVALDPDDTYVHARLAGLLETGTDGRRYGAGAEPAAAIVEYRALRDQGEHDYDAALLETLFVTGQVADAVTLARKMDRGETRDRLLVAALAWSGPVDAAVREAALLETDNADRLRLLVGASHSLAGRRRYDLALLLLDGAERSYGASSGLRNERELLAKVRRSEEVKLDEKDPATPIKRLFMLITSGRVDLAKVAPFFVRAAAEDVKKDAYAIGDLGRALDSADALFDRRTIGDVILGLSVARAEGDDAGGWRVRLEVGPKRLTAYVVRERGELRILGMQPMLAYLGVEAARRVDAKDLAGARRLLDWAREEASGPGEDPASGDAFARFWTRGATPGADATRLAALVLATEADPRATLAALARCAAVHPEDDGACDLAGAQAAVWAEDWAAAVPYLDRLAKRWPDSDMTLLIRTGALDHLGRTADALAAADERLKRQPGDPAGLRARAAAATAAGDFAAARAAFEALDASARASAADLNQLAWLALFDHGDVGAAIEQAKRSLRIRADHAGTINTLAALEAEAGRFTEAHESLLRCLELHAPDPSDFYVQGRIAEGLGFRDLALSAYAEAQKGKDDGPNSTKALARARAAKLAAQP